MTDGTESGGKRRSGTRVRWSVIVLGILLLIPIMVALFVAFPPSDLITAEIEKAVEQATGRDMTVGKSTYLIRETVTVELDDVVLSGPGGNLSVPLFRADAIRATLPLKELMAGRTTLSSLALDGPVLNLIRDGDSEPNWTLPHPPETAAAPVAKSGILGLPVTGIRNGTVLYTDTANAASLRLDAIDARIVMDEKFGGAAANGTFRYSEEPLTFNISLADAEAAFAGKPSAVTLALQGKHLAATLLGDVAVGEAPLLAGEIEATSPSARGLAGWLGFEDVVPETLGGFTMKAKADAATGKAEAAGTASLADQPLTYDVILENVRDLIARKSSAIKAKITGADLTASISGLIAPAEKTIFAGDLAAETPSLGKLASTLGRTEPAITGLGKSTISGKAAIEESAISLDNAAFDVDGRSGDFTGRIETGGPRPVVSGTLELDAVDLDPLLGREPKSPGLSPEAEPPLPIDTGFESTWEALGAELDQIEAKVAGDAIPAATPGAALAAAPAKPLWSTAPIDLSALRTIDLDLAVAARRIKLGALDLTDGKLKTKLVNGDLAATLEDVAIGAGRASGALDLKARAQGHEAALSIAMKNVEAEPISAELAGKALLAGPSNVDLSTTATGRTLNQLVSTLGGNVKFDMSQGRLKGWDIERMLNQFWNYGGWGFNSQRSTPFSSMTAKYEINKGVVKSAPELAMISPVTHLSSRGNVVMPSKQINQTLRIEKLPIPIVVKGDWTKSLWIGPSFLSSLAPEGEGPAALAPEAPSFEAPAAVPANIKAAAERVLGAPRAATVLSERDRAFLQAIATGAGGP